MVLTKGKLAAVTLVLLAIVGGALILWPSAGTARDCITDAELEAAVGDQVQSGAFAINTSMLRKAPMCSGLTVAQAVQKLSAPTQPPAPAASQSPMTETAMSALSGPYAQLAQYVGKPANAKVSGHTLFKHPLVLGKLQEAGVEAGPHLYSLPVHTGSFATRLDGHVLVNKGCFPETCASDYHRLYMNLRTGALALCYVGGQWSERLWFSTVTRDEGLELSGNCPVSWRDAPVRIRDALADGGAALSGSKLAAVGAGLPDISRSLVFSNPRGCESKAFEALFIAAITGKPASLPPLGRIPFRRTGPDKNSWITAKADVKAVWNGLIVTGFEFYQMEESDGTGSILKFSEGSRTTLPVLRKLGFPLIRTNQEFETDGGMPVFISLHEEGGVSELRCGT